MMERRDAMDVEEGDVVYLPDSGDRVVVAEVLVNGDRVHLVPVDDETAAFAYHRRDPVWIDM